MLITLEQTSRRYNYEWIFRDLSFTFKSGSSYAVLGPNGSGKSTLIQCICGFQLFSEGKVKYSMNGLEIEEEKIFQYFSIAAPYQELIEEMTLSEIIRFHESFKPLTKGIKVPDVIDILKLSKHSNKQLKLFSSGMKQRVKLALAVLSDVPIILLDEPANNLDKEGTDWYLGLIEQFTGDKLLIICSNNEKEYAFCKEKILMSDYK